MHYAMNTLSKSEDAGAEVERILANDEIAFIKIHTALAGCLLCVVKRS